MSKLKKEFHMKSRKKRFKNKCKQNKKEIEKALLENNEKFIDDVNRILFLLNQNPTSPDEYVVLNDNTEIESIFTDIKQDIISLSKGINVNRAVPILLYVIDKIYFDATYKDLKYKGIAIKNLIATIWLYGDKHISSKSNLITPDFENLIKKVISLDSLRTYQWLYKLYSKKLSMKIQLSDYGVRIDDENWRYLKSNFIIPENTYGLYQRCVDTNNNLLLKDMNKYFESIKRVLKGEIPSNIEYYKGTYFEYFKGVEDDGFEKFWMGLHIRFVLWMQLCLQENMRDGISYVNDIEFKNYLSQYGEVEYYKENLVWTDNYLDKIYLENYNKIVSRPFVPLFGGKYLFSTSYIMIDSINSYIESFVFGHNGTKTLSRYEDKLFEQTFSKPFEKHVIELFNKFGYAAGGVTEGGTWQIYSENSTKNEEIKNEYFKSNNIGEIDCLAINEAEKKIYVVECKVLNLPTDFSSYRNRITDINGKFKNQLQRKTDFVKNRYAEYYINSILLLDKGFVVKQYETNPDNLRIMTLEILNKELKCTELKSEKEAVEVNYAKTQQVIK